jgi:hypothetical protein
VAKYGRYRDALPGANNGFIIVGFMLALPFTIAIGRAITGIPIPTESQKNLLSNCDGARAELNYALDARDAITPREAFTSSGRAKWEKLRDEARSRQEIKEAACN